MRVTLQFLLVSWRVLDAPDYVTEADLGPLHCHQSVIWGLEGYGRSQWLELGVRDNGNGSAPGPKRILVMGDSYTEALQVDDRETFCSLAEAALRSQGWGVELLNLGQSDRSPADYILLGPAYLRRFRPDWVVLVMDEWDLTGDGWASYKRHFVLKQDRLLVEGQPSEGFEKPWIALLPGLSLLVQYRTKEFEARWADLPPLFNAGQPRKAESVPDYSVEAVLRQIRLTFGERCTLAYVAPFQPRGIPVRTAVEERFFAACQQESLDVVDLLLVAAVGPTTPGVRKRPLEQGARQPLGTSDDRSGAGRASQPATLKNLEPRTVTRSFSVEPESPDALVRTELRGSPIQHHEPPQSSWVWAEPALTGIVKNVQVGDYCHILIQDSKGKEHSLFLGNHKSFDPIVAKPAAYKGKKVRVQWHTVEKNTPKPAAN